MGTKMRWKTEQLLPSSRRRGKRSRGYLFIAVAGVITLAYLLLHRDKIPAALPHTYVAATTPAAPNASACWLETGRLFTATASGILVRHPRGDLLVDSGDSSHLAAELASVPMPQRLLYKLGASLMTPSLSMPQAITAAGLNPAQVKAVIISHLHLDHLGGAMDLSPQTPIWTTAEELAFIPRARKAFAGVPSELDVLKTRGLAIPFSARPYAVFDESADLFGDGSLVVVKLPGHTPGSLGVFINLSPTRRLFYVGDAVSEVSEVEEGLSKRGALRFLDDNKEQTVRTVALLKQLHEQDPSLLIIPAHDRAAFERAFGGGPRCVH